MIRSEKAKRAAIICIRFTLNMAYYRSGFDNHQKLHSYFVTSAVNNSLDICVLEWCKLFGSKKDKHNWSKVVRDRDQFESDMLLSLNISAAKMSDNTQKVLTYRDKFVAHLDFENIMYPPELDFCLDTVSYLFNHLINNELENEIVDKLATEDLVWFYKHHLELGGKFYNKLII